MALRKPKTKAEFFKRERETFDKLRAPSKGLPASAWAQPGAAGDWLLKDVWAHIADWMIETQRVVPRLVHDQKVLVDIPAFNAKHYRMNRAMPASIAQKRLERERKKFLAFVKTLSEEQLLGNRRVYNWVSYSTFNHYAEHIPGLVRFARNVRLQRER